MSSHKLGGHEQGTYQVHARVAPAIGGATQTLILDSGTVLQGVTSIHGLQNQ
jgi:hypothetical protein